MSATPLEPAALSPAELSPAPGIAAVILAAGTSSRMGESKPLLRLGATSAVERVIRSVTRAGIHEIVVVTGHRSDELVSLLDGLGVAHVYNEDYETGMFSSVRAGVGALPGGVDAFFVLPVDCALVRPDVLRRLIRSRRETAAGIIHPTCRGLRGHPPLIAGHYREALAQPGQDGDLGSFLRRRSADEREVEVEDLTILMDMDTPEDYQRLKTFAEILDADTTAGGATEASAAPMSLTPGDELYLLSLLRVPGRVVRHSQAVAAVGRALAEALAGHLPALDPALVHAGCLLHDMAKGSRRHAAVGQTMLENLGLWRLGSLVGSHMVISPENLDAPFPTEEQLVYLADKLVVEDQVKSLEERAARTLQKHAGDAAVAQGVEARLRTSRIIAGRIETIAGRSLEQIVAAAGREAAPDAAPASPPAPGGGIPAQTRIYLARHAEPEGAEGVHRFLGQLDPPLSAVGWRQAGELAQRLKGVTFRAVYSSDLQRSLSTAEAVAVGSGLVIQQEPALREIHAGRWEGLTFDEAKLRYPAEFAERERDLSGFRFPGGGESFRDLEQRVAPIFSQIMASGPGDVLVVAHKGVNRVMLAHFLGMPRERMFEIAQDYCALSIVTASRMPDGGRAITVDLQSGIP